MAELNLIQQDRFGKKFRRIAEQVKGALEEEGFRGVEIKHRDFLVQAKRGDYEIKLIFKSASNTYDHRADTYPISCRISACVEGEHIITDLPIEYIALAKFIVELPDYAKSFYMKILTNSLSDESIESEGDKSIFDQICSRVSDRFQENNDERHKIKEIIDITDNTSTDDWRDYIQFLVGIFKNLPSPADQVGSSNWTQYIQAGQKLYAVALVCFAEEELQDLYKNKN